mgnify:CR=1 FL=1
MARRRDREIRLVLNDGKVFRIPKVLIKEIVMPGIRVRNHYFKLRLEFEDYEKNLEKLRRKFGKILNKK